MAFDFSRIRYRRPSEHTSAKVLSNLIGFDSEAYTDGRSFLFCTSRGDVWGAADIPRKLFTETTRGVNFVVFNLKYESGAILRHLPTPKLQDLRKMSRAEHDGYTYKYYPHKFLRLSRGKNAVTFWDLFPFFQSSLESASTKHLGKHKLSIDTTKFTRPYVREHLNEIIRYCRHDANLTAGLGEWLLAQFARYDIHPSTLYSQASVSFKYIKERVGIVDVWHFWLRHRQSLEYACNTYGGGKFDASSRGRFNGGMWDIDSAYPYEIAQLKDLRDASVRKAQVYLPGADYAFMRCHVSIPVDLPHPVIYRLGQTCMYPTGEWDAYLTKTEYEWLIEHGAGVKLIDGYFINATRSGYPYAKVMQELHAIKANKRDHDETFRYTAKIFLNGFYGKMIQLTPQPDGTLRAGPGWNPLYGAVITANVRVRLSECQRLLGKHALAVHTDGIISTKPLPRYLEGQGMGTFGKKREGDGVIIACGIYEHDGICANRGFTMRPEFRWTTLLKEMRDSSSIKIPETRALSWIAAVHLDVPEEINLFKRLHRNFNVNCDTKRVWFEQATGASLLSHLQESSPRLMMR